MDEIKKKLIRNLLIVIGVFVLVAIILLLFKGCGNKKLTYSQAEKKLVSVSKKYFDKNNLLPTQEGQIAVVATDVLISNKYIKKFETLVGDTCEGKVIVQLNNEEYNYLPYLKCENYETNSFKKEMTSSIVTSGDGVYEMNGEYIYRGENVNNYLKFSGKLWRIIKITDDGYLKIISVKPSEDSYVWDDRYNIDTDDYDGINDYSKSRLKEKIDELYYDEAIVSDDYKDKVTVRSICVGERDDYDYSFKSNTECNKKLDGQYVDLITVSDIYNASIDENCKEVEDYSCTNYNYFDKFFNNSWTTISVKGTTSKVYYTTIDALISKKANIDKKIYYVIYLNANEIIDSGDGSEDSPYILK